MISAMKTGGGREKSGRKETGRQKGDRAAERRPVGRKATGVGKETGLLREEQVSAGRLGYACEYTENLLHPEFATCKCEMEPPFGSISLYICGFPGIYAG